MADKSEKNVKLRAMSTAVIWLSATGMLGICIPLIALTESGIVLPLAVIIGAAASTAVVWRQPAAQSRQSVLASSVQALHQRVANLEEICSSADLDLEHKIKQLTAESEQR